MQSTSRKLTSVSTLALLVGVTAMMLAPSEAQAQAEEIVTTAQRREQSVRDVPIAVSVMSPEILSDLQIKDTVSLVDAVPNLHGGNNTALGTASSYFLRGQGQDESFATFDPAVGTYVDDVFVSRQNANNLNFFDMERLEVLRGPQGTLFGKNTSGGAVNIALRKPADEAGGFFEAGFGKYNRKHVRIVADIPFSDNVRSTFNLFTVKDDGWLTNRITGEDLNGKDATGIRGALSIDFSENVTWDISADYVQDSQTNITGRLESDGEVTTNASLSGRGLAGVSEFAGINSQAARQKSDYGNETKSFNVTSRLTAELDTGTLSFIVGNRSLEQDFLVNFPFPAFSAPAADGEQSDNPFIIDNLGNHDQFSAELKWDATYMDGALDLTTGLFYLEEDNETDVAAYFFALSRDRVISNTAESYAAYAQGDYHINDKLTATVGLRYTDETKEFEISDNNPLAGGAGGIDPNAACVPATVSASGFYSDLTTANMEACGVPTELNESIFTPRFALRYDINDSVNVYASATRGFRSGGWNAREDLAHRHTPFESETIWSYEAGLRSRISDSIDFYATAFVSDLENLQLNTGTAPGQFDIGNVGGLTVKGLELEGTYSPTDNFNLFASIGLMDAEYEPSAGELALCPAGGPNPGLGAFNATCGIARVKRAPDFSLLAGASYDFNIPGVGILTPRGSLRNVSEQVTTSRDRNFVEGYTLYNLGLDLEFENNGVILSLECNNCDNERYSTATFGGGDLYYNTPGRWEARVRYKFGARR